MPNPYYLKAGWGSVIQVAFPSKEWCRQQLYTGDLWGTEAGCDRRDGERHQSALLLGIFGVGQHIVAVCPHSSASLETAQLSSPQKRPGLSHVCGPALLAQPEQMREV